MRAEHRLLLARAVARADHARLLDPGNVAGPLVPLPVAAAGTESYFVTPRAHLLVVDCDLPADPAMAADVLAAFDLLLQAAARAGVANLRVGSGRPGHQHAYLVTGTGPERANLERWCRARGLDVRSHGVRPPGAPHRLPDVPTPDLDPAQVAAAVATLTSAVDADATARLARDLCPVTLPGRVMVAVRYGHLHAGYDSPSHARMALAVAVRARGGSLGLVDAILRDTTSPLGQTYRQRSAPWQRAELIRLWDKAALWLAQGDRARDAAVAQVTAAAAGHGWKGTAGGSDLAVLEHLLRVARRVRSAVVGEALADVGVGAGVSTDTARAAVRRLTTAGWLRVVSRETARTTRTYELRVPAHVDTRDLDTAAGPEPDIFSDLGADVARHQALGKVTVRVARALTGRPGSTAAELAAMLAMSPASVRHHLRKLAAHDVAVGDRYGWSVRATVHAVAALELALGVHGARQAQQEAVDLLRRLRRQARATFARLRRWTPPSHARAPEPRAA